MLEKIRRSYDARRLRKKSRALGRHFLIAPTPGLTIDLSEIGADQEASTAKPCVISFGTRDGFYDRFCETLQKSCDAHGVAHSIETIPPCGRINACLFKPSFIKFKLLTLNRPVIWLDADASLEGEVSLPNSKWDIATLSNNRESEVNKKAAVCIAFQPTVASLRFVETWEGFCSSQWTAPGLDHERMNYTREVMRGQYVEADLSPYVSGKIVRDSGRKKEFRF